jgi:hypothetical protein
MDAVFTDINRSVALREVVTAVPNNRGKLPHSDLTPVSWAPLPLLELHLSIENLNPLFLCAFGIDFCIEYRRCSPGWSKLVA